MRRSENKAEGTRQKAQAAIPKVYREIQARGGPGQPALKPSHLAWLFRTPRAKLNAIHRAWKAEQEAQTPSPAPRPP